MMVQVPDSAPNFGAGPGVEPKNYEILKFGNLTVFKVFSYMDGVNIKFG